MLSRGNRTLLEEREEGGYQRNAQISRQKKISIYYEEIQTQLYRRSC